MDIIRAAHRLIAAVTRYSKRAKRFFYEVMLSEYVCPRCDGNLAMVGESCCRCRACGYTFDPTVIFQRCSDCGGEPVLKVRRYQCRQCGADVPSRFVFEGLVFDTYYFRQKMAESRQRKQERREELRERVTENRSPALEPPIAELETIPGLVDALNGLTGGLELLQLPSVRKGFDLNRYEKHLQKCIGLLEVCFDDIPPLEENPRKDRIWRFIAIIFMAHAQIIKVTQQGQTILVSKIEAN